MAGKSQKRLTEDDKLCVARYLVRYADALPGTALKRVMEIELLRNNYTKNTLYNMLRGVRQIKRRGTIPKNNILNKELAALVLKLMDKEPAPATNNVHVPTAKELYKKKLAEYDKIKKYFQSETTRLEEVIEKAQEEKEKLEKVMFRLGHKKQEELQAAEVAMYEEKILGAQ